MASTPGTGTARQLTLLACLAVCTLGPLSGITQTAMPPVLPRIAEHFADVPNAGLLARAMMTGLSIAMVFGALASGFLAERLGQLRLMFICLGAYALSGLASFFVDNLYFLVAMRIVLGLANSAMGVLGTAILATRLTGHRRDKWLGLFVTIGTVMSLVWVSLAGVLGAIDWRLIFLLQLLAIPAAVFIGLTVSGDAPRSADAAAKTQAGEIPVAMTLFGLLCGGIGSSVFIFLPFHLADIGLGDPKKIGLLLMISSAAGVAAALSFGWLRTFLAAIPVFAGGFVLTGAGLLVALTTDNFIALSVALAVYGAGFGVVTPNLFSACSAATRMEMRTRVLGFMRAGFYAGPLLAQFPLEAIVRQGGASAALMTLGVASLAAAALFVVFRGYFKPLPEEAAA
ncbi:MAG: MFS transporter [Novosphingobium sp.]